MAAVFSGVDSHGGPGEPMPKDQALIGRIVHRHRKASAALIAQDLPCSRCKSPSACGS
jgi:hypothetical protein